MTNSEKSIISLVRMTIKSVINMLQSLEAKLIEDQKEGE